MALAGTIILSANASAQKSAMLDELHRLGKIERGVYEAVVVWMIQRACNYTRVPRDDLELIGRAFRIWDPAATDRGEERARRWLASNRYYSAG